MNNLNYNEARLLIKSGDIINFFTSHEESWYHRIVTLFVLYFTGSPIYHSGVAIWMTSEHGERRLMLVEAIGIGRRIIDLSHFKTHKMEVHCAPDWLNKSVMEEFALLDLGKGYGFWNLIAISLREFFGIKAKDTRGQVCSQFAAMTWEAGGMQFDSTSISPGKLRNELISKGSPPILTINSDS